MIALSGPSDLGRLVGFLALVAAALLIGSIVEVWMRRRRAARCRGLRDRLRAIDDELASVRQNVVLCWMLERGRALGLGEPDGGAIASVRHGRATIRLFDGPRTVEITVPESGPLTVRRKDRDGHARFVEHVEDLAEDLRWLLGRATDGGVAS